jgi:hypothetical protein
LGEVNPETIYEARKFLEVALAELATKKAIENHDAPGAREVVLNYMIYLKEPLL